MSSPETRLPALPPPASSLLSKLGWSLAVALGLLAALLASRYFALASAVTLLTNDAELNRIEVQSLQQQLEAERIIAARQIADLTAKSTSEPLVFARLASPESSSPRLTAFVAWQPASQSGVFFADPLPPLAPDEEYRLWIEAGTGNSLNAGVIIVAATGPTKVAFSLGQAINQLASFTVTREPSGTTTTPTGPVILRGTP